MMHLVAVTRVPESHNLAKEMIQTPDEKFVWTEIDENYKMTCVKQTYKKIEQRWCLVFSKHAYAREIVTFEKRLEVDLSDTSKALGQLSKQQFKCEHDAEKQLNSFKKKLKRCAYSKRKVHTSEQSA